MTKMLVLAMLASGIASGASAQDSALRESVAADYRANLGALFDHFHRNPELSGREVQTSARMAQELRALGYEVTTGIGGHGVVALLRNGDGPTVLLRADMDGLPLEERSGLPNASRARQTDASGAEQPVMHACGHDVHITALVGTARQLMARRANWSGTLVLIAQPAEETISGARTMVEDGLYTRFPKPDYAVAFHVAAGLPAGRISVPSTIAYSSADSVEIEVRGTGTHGAYPHLGVDPVLVASQIVVSLQSMVGRDIDPLQGAVISVGSIHGGVKSNIIPERVVLQMTVRADTPEVRTRLLDGIDRVARGTALALGVPEDRLPVVTRSPTETTPATINDSATADIVRRAIATQMGADRLTDQPRDGMGAEDFAYFVTPESGVKGVYFAVGGTPADQVATAPGHHSPLFRIQPEPSVTTGVEAMVIAAETLMPRR
ncbi:amidohydrolase [Sphingosinicella sp. LHD-64]|uniref:amidohydrolase n=1 Tax=Sphingosinicella sp. LHD-64 TaxID=3072139 RepID=UPI00280D0780|nr:amidohydrolase [Sphingosinicella sp. LHD-64]MDQ8755765.1 amidohydrolase [Sphingosinicella sp. LHD-64]